jgi:hypothetical protein
LAEEIKGKQAGVLAGTLGVRSMEVRPTVGKQADGLAVDQHILDLEALDRGDDPREGLGPVPAVARP